MRVRFVHLKAEIDKSQAMPAPKRVEDINAWLKQARKTIPEIPDTKPPAKWKVRHSHATPHLVVFELFNGEDLHSKAYDFCHVVINRTASSLG